MDLGFGIWDSKLKFWPSEERGFGRLVVLATSGLGSTGLTE